MTTCPVCGAPVTIIRREDGSADHYTFLDYDGDPDDLPALDEKTHAELQAARKGKKTVAIVGVAVTHATLAPFDDYEVEIWVLNEMYALSWVKRITRLFQLHKETSWKKNKKDKYDHLVNSYDWLTKTTVPVYMQVHHDDIPASIEYPFQEISKQYPYSVFTSTLAYMVAMAIQEKFERIEVYGIDMSGGSEYANQKPGMLFWLGVAIGKGIEVYVPPNCQLFQSPLYGR